jgi:hypothetical protein
MAPLACSGYTITGEICPGNGDQLNAPARPHEIKIRLSEFHRCVARARLPAVVGLLLSGVVLGPYVLGIFGERTPIADFFAELGKLFADVPRRS